MQLELQSTTQEFLDERGVRWAVRLCRRMRVGVVIYGPLSASIEWQREWGRWQPRRNPETTAKRLIEEFQRRQEPAERINELLDAARRQPAAATNGRHQACHNQDAHERQLPVADRA